jgi:hypothetical protein
LRIEATLLLAAVKEEKLMMFSRWWILAMASWSLEERSRGWAGGR